MKEIDKQFRKMRGQRRTAYTKSTKKAKQTSEFGWEEYIDEATGQGKFKDELHSENLAMQKQGRTTMRSDSSRTGEAWTAKDVNLKKEYRAALSGAIKEIKEEGAERKSQMQERQSELAEEMAFQKMIMRDFENTLNAIARAEERLHKQKESSEKKRQDKLDKLNEKKEEEGTLFYKMNEMLSNQFFDLMGATGMMGFKTIRGLRFIGRFGQDFMKGGIGETGLMKPVKDFMNIGKTDTQGKIDELQQEGDDDKGDYVEKATDLANQKQTALEDYNAARGKATTTSTQTSGNVAGKLGPSSGAVPGGAGMAKGATGGSGLAQGASSGAAPTSGGGAATAGAGGMSAAAMVAIGAVIAVVLIVVGVLYLMYKLLKKMAENSEVFKAGQTAVKGLLGGIMDTILLLAMALIDKIGIINLALSFTQDFLLPDYLEFKEDGSLGFKDPDVKNMAITPAGFIGMFGPTWYQEVNAALWEKIFGSEMPTITVADVINWGKQAWNLALITWDKYDEDVYEVLRWIRMFSWTDLINKAVVQVKATEAYNMIGRFNASSLLNLAVGSATGATGVSAQSITLNKAFSFGGKFSPRAMFSGFGIDGSYPTSLTALNLSSVLSFSNKFSVLDLLSDAKKSLKLSDYLDITPDKLTSYITAKASDFQTFIDDFAAAIWKGIKDEVPGI